MARQSRMRLPAELIRDSALAASGLLYPASADPAFAPRNPRGRQKAGKQNGTKVREGAIQARPVYSISSACRLIRNWRISKCRPDIVRAGATGPIRRCNRSNLLNDPVFFEAAQALAVRILTESARRLSPTPGLRVSARSGAPA